MPWVTGILLAGGIAIAGRRAGALSDGGAAGAVLVGGTIFGRGGKRLALPLIGFFVSSSLLSRIGKTNSAVEAVTVKGGQRDFMQVLANGGVPAGMAVAGGDLLPASMTNAAYIGTLAAVTADTWSTEIGGLSPAPPRSILNGRVVPAGLSGGVTLLGLVGAALGGAFIGVVGWSAARKSGTNRLVRFVWRSALVGLAGSLLDSLLGATLQQIYFCPTCGTLTEQPIHSCGTMAKPKRGYAWVTNDMVNLLTSLSGALIGVWLIPNESEE